MANGQQQFGAPPPHHPHGPYPGPQQQQQASTMATVSMVLGLVSWVAGGIFTAIPGAIIGKMEMNKIDRGESPEAGRTFAMVGFWASLAHIIITVIALIFTCIIFGGFFLTMLGLGAAGAGSSY